MCIGIRRLSFVLTACIWAVARAVAQQPLPQPQLTGTIIGTVLDVTGSTVPTATVVLQGTNERRTVVKGDDGFFRFDLAAGALQNSYYPTRDRGPGLVVSGALIGAGGRMARGIVQEFLLPKWTSRHSTQPW